MNTLFFLCFSIHPFFRPFSFLSDSSQHFAFGVSVILYFHAVTEFPFWLLLFNHLSKRLKMEVSDESF